ncbi:MAG: phosphoglycolate phosphatase [Burkholderiales bacterium]
MSVTLAALVAPIKGVAFDLDGTLLDTLPDIAGAGNAMLADLGREAVSESVVRSYIGDGIPTLAKRLLTLSRDGEPDRGLFDQALASFQAHYFAGLNRQTRAFPGVVEGLHVLRDARIPLACVTNKAERFTRPLLEAHGMSAFFEVVLGGDSLPRKKPDPLPLLHCCRAFRLRPEELLLVGDSLVDVRAAKAAGCVAACVPYGYTGGRDVRDLGADAIVPGVLELARAIVLAHPLPA